MSIRESRVERETVKFAEQMGWRSIKLAGNGSNGKPDRLFFRGPPPVIIFIEFKQEGKQLEPLQRIWKRWLTMVGFEHYTVDTIEEGRRIFVTAEQSS